MKKNVLNLIALCLFTSLAVVSCSKKDDALEKIVARPTPTVYVNDMTHIFNDTTQRAENKLKDLKENHGYNMVALSVEDLAGYGAQFYASKVIEKWELGDSSVVVVFKGTPTSKGFEVGLAVGKALQSSFTPNYTRQFVNDRIAYVLQKKRDYNNALVHAIVGVKEKLGVLDERDTNNKASAEKMQEK